MAYISEELDLHVCQLARPLHFFGLQAYRYFLAFTLDLGIDYEGRRRQRDENPQKPCPPCPVPWRKYPYSDFLYVRGIDVVCIPHPYFKLVFSCPEHSYLNYVPGNVHPFALAFDPVGIRRVVVSEDQVGECEHQRPESFL